MTLITGMLISGKMSVGMVRSANGVASTISIAITMNVYGRRSASATMDMPERPDLDWEVDDLIRKARD